MQSALHHRLGVLKWLRLRILLGGRLLVIWNLALHLAFNLDVLVLILDVMLLKHARALSLLILVWGEDHLLSQVFLIVVHLRSLMLNWVGMNLFWLWLILECLWLMLNRLDLDLGYLWLMLDRLDMIKDCLLLMLNRLDMIKDCLWLMLNRLDLDLGYLWLMLDRLDLDLGYLWLAFNRRVFYLLKLNKI